MRAGSPSTFGSVIRSVLPVSRPPRDRLHRAAPSPPVPMRGVTSAGPTVALSGRFPGVFWVNLLTGRPRRSPKIALRRPFLSGPDDLAVLVRNQKTLAKGRSPRGRQLLRFASNLPKLRTSRANVLVPSRRSRWRRQAPASAELHRAARHKSGAWMLDVSGALVHDEARDPAPSEIQRHGQPDRPGTDHQHVRLLGNRQQTVCHRQPPWLRRLLVDVIRSRLSLWLRP